MIACAIGTVLGMIAGFFGGIVDDVINRTSEAIRVIPQIVFAIALCAVFGGGVGNLAIILGISNMTIYIRMMRSQCSPSRSATTSWRASFRATAPSG